MKKIKRGKNIKKKKTEKKKQKKECMENISDTASNGYLHFSTHIITTTIQPSNAV